MTLEEWNYIYQKSSEVVKSKLKKKGIVIDSESFEEMVFNTTTEYFNEIIQNNKKVPVESLFSYLWALSKRTSLSWSMQILDKDQFITDQHRSLPINLTRLQAQTPLGHLVLSSITSKSDEKHIQHIFHKYVRIRSVPASRDLVSPYHSDIPIEYWIKNRLNDFKLDPQNQYFIYKWGIATEDFDPRDYGLYRTEKVLEVIDIKNICEKQLFLKL